MKRILYFIGLLLLVFGVLMCIIFWAKEVLYVVWCGGAVLAIWMLWDLAKTLSDK